MPIAPRERHPNQRALSTLPVELRRTTVPPAVRDWVAREVGAAVIAAKRLAGASTTAVHGLRLSDGQRLVLRRYVWRWVLLDEPIAPQREVDAIRFAGARGLPVPEVVAADVTGRAVGDGVPALLMTLVPGRAIAVPDLDRLAELAATIHSTAADELGHDYFPWYEDTTVSAPAASTSPKLWERAIELWHNAMPAYRPMFIHRDFHPGNVLWSRGRLCGVVDWASVCRGPWGCDVAHCRDNLLALSGSDSADRFQRAYESLTGELFHPFWEMASILEHGPSLWTPNQLAIDEPRIARAIAAMT